MTGLWTRVAVALMVAIMAATTGVVPGQAAESAAPPKVELVMLEQQGCPWCSRWNAEIGGIYGKTDEGQAAPLRRIDIHEPLPDDLKTLTKGVFTPTFILIADGREVGRIRGYPGADFFFPLLQELLAKAKSAKLDKTQR